MENDAKREIESNEQNKANPTPAFCPLAPWVSGVEDTQGSEAGWQGGVEHSVGGVRPALAWPVSFPGLCSGSDMEEAGLRH